MLLLLPSALLAAGAALLLLLNFTLVSLLVQHGLQPHTQPRSAAQPGTFASLCRQIVSKSLIAHLRAEHAIE